MLHTPNYDWSKRAYNLGEDLGTRLDRVVKQASSFWQRVSEGISVQQLWRQFVSEARASYGLYSREVEWEPVEGEPGWKRSWRITRTLFWAMMMKLSPARRVFFLIALVLVFLELFNLHLFGWPRELYIALAAGSLLFLLALELADRVTMKRDLEIAKEIQRWHVPSVPPVISGLDIAFTTRPANTVAGDYYDAFLRPAPAGTSNMAALPSQRLLLVVADVAGKSVPAALLMATFQASLHTLATASLALPDLVEALNNYACAHSLGGLRFTTAFLADLEPEARALTYVSAGHNAPILRRASGQIERLEAGGLPLGIARGARHNYGNTTLSSGDLLVIFTDGVVEAHNGSGEEYGEPRLLQLLSSPPVSSAGDDLRRLMASVDTFVGTARQHDDITCLVLRCL
ncbi:MAG TPA: PP2C family protein-serine/threonine phosphatase [Terriglobia bacterium]|nr:PP2C family protein-serine/threonine phosphatase [Terriglobia bacterium]